ncbi:hypothetical protein HYE82_20880 [Streptomyces sp. BR123]|uniref:hypothetical protein n=1 Tax=Streptomyces sp. BR123 TaxID=2749828 RepID=UPI0015C42BF0|nr:hypothetical protein [Streptomyces sp. BR123]NXY96794.1 hypothetical protein [Streptomyces sp. BR123]
MALLRRHLGGDRFSVADPADRIGDASARVLVADLPECRMVSVLQTAPRSRPDGG